MKLICLPYAISKLIKILSYIAVALLDIVHFLLTPVTWIQFKSHIAMFLFAGAGYAYLRFFVQYSSAHWIAIGGLFTVVAAVILIKLLRKMLHRIRQSLIKIVYYPLNTCFYIKPNVFTKVFFISQNNTELVTLN